MPAGWPKALKSYGQRDDAMAFESLSEKLNAAFKKMRGKGRLSLSVGERVLFERKNREDTPWTAAFARHGQRIWRL